MTNGGRLVSAPTFQNHRSALAIPNNIDSLLLQSHHRTTWQQASYLDINLETFDDYRRRGIVPNITSPQEEQAAQRHNYTGSEACG
jgi:hypothetical protein